MSKPTIFFPVEISGFVLNILSRSKRNQVTKYTQGFMWH